MSVTVAASSHQRPIVAGKREQRHFGAVQWFGVRFDRAQSQRASRPFLAGDDLRPAGRRADSQRVIRHGRKFTAASFAADYNHRRRRHRHHHLIFLVVPLRFRIVFVFAVARAQVSIARPKLVEPPFSSRFHF